MDVAFFGTSEFGADALERLSATSGIEITAVVTQPDRRRAGAAGQAAAGRRSRPARSASTLVQTADASAAPPPAEAGVVVAFGQLVRDPLLRAYPLFNLHPSLLPRWRGAAPIERAIMAGDSETGVCVIELVAELDAGPVHAPSAIPLGGRRRRRRRAGAGARARRAAARRRTAR